MSKKRSKQHTIEMVFPLIFIVVFCLCVMILILGGSRIYQKTADGLQENYTLRTAVPYIQEKCRECGNPSQIEVMQTAQGNCLAIYKEIKDREYASYIYQSEGYLRELYTKKSEEPSWQAGQKLVRADYFEVNWENEELLHVVIGNEEKREEFYICPGRLQWSQK